MTTEVPSLQERLRDPVPWPCLRALTGAPSGLPGRGVQGLGWALRASWGLHFVGRLLAGYRSEQRPPGPRTELVVEAGRAIKGVSLLSTSLAPTPTPVSPDGHSGRLRPSRQASGTRREHCGSHHRPGRSLRPLARLRSPW